MKLKFCCRCGEPMEGLFCEECGGILHKDKPISQTLKKEKIRKLKVNIYQK